MTICLETDEDVCMISSLITNVISWELKDVTLANKTGVNIEIDMEYILMPLGRDAEVTITIKG